MTKARSYDDIKINNLLKQQALLRDLTDNNQATNLLNRVKKLNERVNSRAYKQYSPQTRRGRTKLTLLQWSQEPMPDANPSDGTLTLDLYDKCDTREVLQAQKNHTLQNWIDRKRQATAAAKVRAKSTPRKTPKRPTTITITKWLEESLELDKSQITKKALESDLIDRCGIDEYIRLKDEKKLDGYLDEKLQKMALSYLTKLEDNKKLKECRQGAIEETAYDLLNSPEFISQYQKVDEKIQDIIKKEASPLYVKHITAEEKTKEKADRVNTKIAKIEKVIAIKKSQCNR